MKNSKSYRDLKGEEGFSLIELVVAVAILAILSIVGVVAYSKITDNARQAVVDNTAAQVLKAAIAYKTDGTKTAKDAETEWNNSADTETISVEVQDNSQCITVIATHAEGETATRMAGDGCGGITPPAGEDNNQGNTEAFKYRINLEIRGWLITDDDSELDSIQVRFPLTDDVFTAPKVDELGTFETFETFDIPGSSGLTEADFDHLFDEGMTEEYFNQALELYGRDENSSPGIVACSRMPDQDTFEGSTEIKAYECSILSV